MYNNRGDTWFDEIRLPIRNSQYEYPNNFNDSHNLNHSSMTDTTYVDGDMNINEYVEMKTYDETKQLQEKGAYGQVYDKCEKCHECCTMDRCIPCFICLLCLMFILVFVIIYNATDFDTAFKYCQKNLDKPVQGIVVYRNQSIASFEYEFKYNSIYIFNITCNIIVNNSPNYPVGTVQKLYISESRDECSFNDHWCNSYKLDKATAFFLSLLGTFIICPLTLPCFIFVIKTCDKNNN